MAYSIRAIKLFRHGSFPRFQNCLKDLTEFNPYACNLFISHRWISQTQADDGSCFAVFVEMLLRMCNRMTNKKFLSEPRNHNQAMFDVEYLFDRTMGHDLYHNVMDRTPEDDAVLSKYLNLDLLSDEQVVEIISYLNDIYIWFDYTCIPQEPRSEKDRAVLNIALSKMPWILEHSYTVCIWDGTEYFRGWCILEYLIATQLGYRAMYHAQPCDIRKMQTPPQGSVYSTPSQSFTDGLMNEDPLFDTGLGQPRNYFEDAAPAFLQTLVGIQSEAAILEVFAQNRVECSHPHDLPRVAALVARYNTRYAGFEKHQPVFSTRVPVDFRAKLLNQLKNLYHGGEKIFSPVLFEHVDTPEHPINHEKYQALIQASIGQPFYKDFNLEFHPRLLNVYSPELLILTYYFVSDFQAGLVSNEGTEIITNHVPKQDISLIFKYPKVRSRYDYNLGVRNKEILKVMLKKEMKRLDNKGCSVM